MARVMFPSCSVVYDFLNKVSQALLTDKNLFWNKTTELREEVNRDVIPKTFPLVTAEYWQLQPPGISNNAPLFNLHFFPAGGFFAFSLSFSPSLPLPVKCVRGERSQAPVMFTTWRLLTHYALVTSLQKQSQGCGKQQAN